jgi:lactate dehydrogenase-like 2-hydroxyacid dehydrogenase
MRKIRVYFTSPVFKLIASNSKVSEEKRVKLTELWNELEKKSEIYISDSRFPSEKEIEEIVDVWKPQVIGCHLSHKITKKILEHSEVIAVCTSTAGYNHIDQQPGILITHTPGVLHQTVADFTITLMLASLRNIVGLHKFVWEGEWNSDQKWDLDENLSSTVDSKTVGIIGLGEIGKEVVKRLDPWGIKIFYYDLHQQTEFENQVKNITFIDDINDIFKKSDIVSLHIPLNNTTKHLIGKKYLKLMKKDALLVNTARGAIINFSDLIELLDKRKLEINLAFDVYEDEPIQTELLEKFRTIAERNKNLKFNFAPHNASADSETRAQMAIMLLEDILKIVVSKSKKDLRGIHLIPEQKFLLADDQKVLSMDNYRINSIWE